MLCNVWWNDVVRKRKGQAEGVCQARTSIQVPRLLLSLTLSICNISLPSYILRPNLNNHGGLEFELKIRSAQMHLCARSTIHVQSAMHIRVGAKEEHLFTYSMNRQTHATQDRMAQTATWLQLSRPLIHRQPLSSFSSIAANILAISS